MQHRTGLIPRFRLSILAFSGGFRLLLAFYARLLIMLTATYFCEDAGTGTFAFEPLQSAFKGFIFTNANFHLFPPSLRRFLLLGEDAGNYYMQGKTISQERNPREIPCRSVFFPGALSRSDPFPFSPPMWYNEAAVLPRKGCTRFENRPVYRQFFPHRGRRGTRRL